MDPTIAELNQKIDALTAQVTYLAEQAHAAERARQERAELLQVLTPIAEDAVRLASDQLEEVQDYVDLPDLLRLVKKLLRHLPQLETLLDQMDGAFELLEVAGPIAREGMDKATSVLDGLDRKGYFSLARSGARAVDHVVTSLSAEDVDRMGEALVPVVEIVKDIAKPEVIHFVHDTLLAAETEVKKPVDSSYFSLLRQVRDPAVRRALALSLRVLRVIGEQASANGDNR